jgi:hypothetical protein
VTGQDAFQRADTAFEAAVRESERAERELRESPDFQRRLDGIEQHARSRAAPRELRALQRRIDNGELSWYGIATGKHLDDPDVRAALAAGLTEPFPEYEDDGDRRGYAFTHFDPDAD